MTDLSGAAPPAPFGGATLLRRGSIVARTRRRSLAPAPGASSLRRRAGRAVASVAVVVATLAAVAVAAGWVTPVVTYGTSMIPTYHAGDLVIVADSSSYATGDIVGYRYGARQMIVLHRIVGGNGTDGFEMQGDNNASVDPYAPTRDDVIGRAVVHIPKVGVLVRSRAGVIGFLGAVMLLGVVVVAGTEPYPSRRRVERRLRQFQRRRERPTRARHPTAKAPPPTGGAPPTAVVPVVRLDPAIPTSSAVAARATAASSRTGGPAPRGPGRSAVALLVALLVADVLAGAALVASFAMPPRTDPPAAAPQQTALLRYGATVTPGVAYPDGVIVTGQPVFRQIADRVDVSFDYDLSAPPGGTLRADASLWVDVLSTSGWSRTIVLAQSPVTSLPARLTGTLDLSATAAIVTALSAETGVPTGAASIRIGATVTPTVDGLPGTVSTTTMDFDLSDKALVMRAAEQVTVGAPGGPAMTSTTALGDATAAKEHGGVPRAWRRWIVIALLALVALTALVWPARDTSNVVPVSELDVSPNVTRIRMDDPAALDEIAAHERAPVLAGPGWRAVIVEQRLYWDGEHEPGVTTGAPRPD